MTTFSWGCLLYSLRVCFTGSSVWAARPQWQDGLSGGWGGWGQRRCGEDFGKGANECHCNAVRGGAKNTHWHRGSNFQAGSQTNIQTSNLRRFIHASPGRETHTRGHTQSCKLTRSALTIKQAKWHAVSQTGNPSEFELAGMFLESVKHRALSSLKHESSEQTKPTAGRWIRGIRGSCFVCNLSFDAVNTD